MFNSGSGFDCNVFAISNQNGVNRANTAHIAYCFARTPGMVAVGSYTGNNSSDGTYVVVDDGASGFRPAWLLIKNVDASESWNLRDSARDPTNVTKQIISPNSNAVEATSGGGQFIDLLSNGFKCRGNDPGINSSATFIYIAFAEHPFGGSGVAQARTR